jgi:hypothetical protein
MTDMALTPVIAVDSVEVPGLARDTVRLAVHGRVRRATRLRLTVLSSPDALVDPVDGPGLRVGAWCGVSLDVGETRVPLFDGEVTSLTLRAPADGPPVVVIDAQDSRRPGPTAGRSAGTFVLRHGQDLVAVRVRTDRAAGPGPGPGSGSGAVRTRVVGEVVGLPSLAVGAKVTLDGVGAYVDGRALRVTAVRHVVDLQRGLWTRFRARAAG